jgi:uncharacterized protein YcaQ
METITLRQARRLALARSGFLKSEVTGLPNRARGAGAQALDRCHQIIDRFGYLQLDSVSVAGARSHAIVLASRLEGLDAALAERLLAPGQPLFEYWGHEASWMPLQMYPWFGFRRRAFEVHPWWGDLLGEHPRLAREIIKRIEIEGPLRSADLEGNSGQGWWDLKLSKRIVEALWSAGMLAVVSRQGFLRSFDLAERVIPDGLRSVSLSDEASYDQLLLKALDGHGWASTGTLASTWRLKNCREAVTQSLSRLLEAGVVRSCALVCDDKRIKGWIRTEHLPQLDVLERLRPPAAKGVLLSPFDPLLWDRKRTALLFDFVQVLEIYKPAAQRKHGYYCLPVLAGERLIARVDLKADRTAGTVRTLACHYEQTQRSGRSRAQHQQAVASALQRFGHSLGLDPVHDETVVLPAPEQ